MPDAKKVTNFNDIKNRAATQSQLSERSMIELAENDPLEYYNKLLDFNFVGTVQTEIAELMNESELVKKYDPLTLACGMMALIEDTFGAMIADAVYSNIMAAYPEASPTEVAEKADAENATISNRILDIRSYIADKMNERQTTQAEQNLPQDRPADDVMAIASILRQAIGIMLSTTKAFVEYNMNQPDDAGEGGGNPNGNNEN